MSFFEAGVKEENARCTATPCMHCAGPCAPGSCAVWGKLSRLGSSASRAGFKFFFVCILFFGKIFPALWDLLGTDTLAMLALSSSPELLKARHGLQSAELQRRFALLGGLSHTAVFLSGIALRVIVITPLSQSLSRRILVRGRRPPPRSSALSAFRSSTSTPQLQQSDSYPDKQRRYIRSFVSVCVTSIIILSFHRFAWSVLSYCWSVHFLPVIWYAKLFFTDSAESEFVFLHAAAVSYTCALILGVLTDVHHTTSPFEQAFLPWRSLDLWVNKVGPTFALWAVTVDTLVIPLTSTLSLSHLSEFFCSYNNDNTKCGIGGCGNVVLTCASIFLSTDICSAISDRTFLMNAATGYGLASHGSTYASFGDVIMNYGMSRLSWFPDADLSELGRGEGEGNTKSVVAAELFAVAAGLFLMRSELLESTEAFIKVFALLACHTCLLWSPAALLLMVLLFVGSKRDLALAKWYFPLPLPSLNIRVESDSDKELYQIQRRLRVYVPKRLRKKATSRQRAMLFANASTLTRNNSARTSTKTKTPADTKINPGSCRNGSMFSMLPVELAMTVIGLLDAGSLVCLALSSYGDLKQTVSALGMISVSQQQQQQLQHRVLNEGNTFDKKEREEEEEDMFVDCGVASAARWARCHTLSHSSHPLECCASINGLVAATLVAPTNNNGLLSTLKNVDVVVVVQSADSDGNCGTQDVAQRKNEYSDMMTREDVLDDRNLKVKRRHHIISHFNLFLTSYAWRGVPNAKVVGTVSTLSSFDNNNNNNNINNGGGNDHNHNNNNNQTHQFVSVSDDEDSFLFKADGSRVLVVLDAKTGKERWRLDVGTNDTLTCAVLGVNGTLLVLATASVVWWYTDVPLPPSPVTKHTSLSSNPEQNPNINADCMSLRESGRWIPFVSPRHRDSISAVKLLGLDSIVVADSERGGVAIFSLSKRTVVAREKDAWVGAPMFTSHLGVACGGSAVVCGQTMESGLSSIILDSSLRFIRLAPLGDAWETFALACAPNGIVTALVDSPPLTLIGYTVDGTLLYQFAIASAFADDIDECIVSECNDNILNARSRDACVLLMADAKPLLWSDGTITTLVLGGSEVLVFAALTGALMQHTRLLRRNSAESAYDHVAVSGAAMSARHRSLLLSYEGEDGGDEVEVEQQQHHQDQQQDNCQRVMLWDLSMPAIAPGPIS